MVSLVYQLSRKLLSVPAPVLRRELLPWTSRWISSWISPARPGRRTTSAEVGAADARVGAKLSASSGQGDPAEIDDVAPISQGQRGQCILLDQ